MPIYEQTYRRYEARGPLRKARFWPITREALRLILAKRAFLGLLVLSWLPFFGFLLYIFAVTRFPVVGRVVPVDGRLFGEFMAVQIQFSLLVTVFGGAGLVANDLRTGAILVYLSRPLTRRDYVAGKLGVLLALNFAVTLAPGLLLYVLGAALAPDQLFKRDLAWIAPAVLLQSLVLSLVMSLVALAISALSRSARVAGVGFFALTLALGVVSLILRGILRSRLVGLLSLWDDVRSVGDALFGVARRGETLPWHYAVLVLAAICLASLAILRSRVRAVEVVT